MYLRTKTREFQAKKKKETNKAYAPAEYDEGRRLMNRDTIFRGMQSVAPPPNQ